MSSKQSSLAIGATLRGRLIVPQDDLDRIVLSGVGPVEEDYYDRDRDLVGLSFAGRHNAFVNQGLQRLLDSFYAALTAQRITHIGLSNDTAAVTAATTTLGTTNSIKTVANVSRSGQVVSAEQTWTQSDVSFAITKIGLLTSSAPTSVVNIVGGVGGASPYNEPFTIDLRNISVWSLTMGLDVTATAS